MLADSNPTNVTYKFVIKSSDDEKIEFEGTSSEENRHLELDIAEKVVKDGKTVYVLPEAVWMLSERNHPGYSGFVQYLEWNRILKNVLVGTCPRSWDDMRRIRDDAGATAVFNVQEQSDVDKHCPQISQKDIRHEYAHLGVVYVHLPIKDFCDGDKERKLADAVFLMDGLIRSGHVVYCHCTAGIGRSIAITCAWMNWVKQWDMPRVFNHVRNSRPKAYLNANPINNSAWEFKKKYGACIEAMKRIPTLIEDGADAESQPNGTA